MKKLSLFALLFLLVFGVRSFARDLHGSLFISGGKYYFTEQSSKKTFLLKTDDPQVQAALFRLKTDDSLIGTGTLLSENTMLLESVDFVALRRLIGVWQGPSTVIKFVDYSRVHFQLPAGTNNKYTYALAPADGDNWRIFFTDNSSVVLGSLTVENLKARIELYDSRTGSVYQRYDLQKIKY